MDAIATSLLAAVILSASATAGQPAPSSKAEEKALDAVQELGARVVRDEKKPARPVIAVAFRGTRVSDEGLASLQEFSQLERLNLGGTRITDAGLRYLRKLTQLRTLTLWDTKITDAGMAHLRGLAQLRVLGLCGTKITDAGIRHLAGLHQLSELDLRGTQVTDTGLGHLKNLTQLRNLEVSGEKVTDNGIAHLTGLVHLESLDLGWTKVTDAGLAHLQHFTDLRELSLSDTQLTDAGLAHLKGLKRLRKLNLSYTKVTDAGLANLQGFTHLESIDLGRTGVTSTGLARLKCLPHLKTIEVAGAASLEALPKNVLARALLLPFPPEDEDERTPEFEVEARLELPENQYSACSAVLRAPWVYVLDSQGDLSVFRIPDHGTAQQRASEDRPKVKPLRVIRNVGDGHYLARWGDALIASWFGNLEIYSLSDPLEPKRLGRSRTLSKRNYDAQAIVRNGNRAYVVGDCAVLIYDLSNPFEPKCVAEQTTQYDAYAGCVEGGYLFLGGSKGDASGERYGVAVFEIANTAQLKELAFVPVSRPIYHVFALPGKRLLASLDADTRFDDGSSQAHGKAALLDVVDPGHPRLVKEMANCGGRAATLLCTQDRTYFVCHRAVFSVRGQDLVPCFSFDSQGSAISGFPYHGDTDGVRAALSLDNVGVVLRLRSGR